jgi:hypothetical protein
MMRKVILALTGTAVLAVLMASVVSGASGASGHARAHSSSTALCNTLYTPRCTSPAVAVKSIGGCRHAGSVVTVPVNVSANAGLRKITVTFRGKTIWSLTYKTPTTKRAFNVAIHTAGLGSTVYTVFIKVTDVNGKTSTKVAHFTICKTAAVLPAFTG